MTDYDSYGITDAMSTENLVRAITVYRELVGKLAGTATPLSEVEQTVTDEIRRDAATFGEVSVLTTSVRDEVLGTLFRNPAMAVRFADELKSLLTDVRNLRDYHVSTVARTRKVALPARTSSDALREDATGIRDFIGTAFTFLLGQVPKKGKKSSWKGFDPEQWATVPTKKGKNGLLLDLPQVPGSKKGSGSAGRGQAYKIALFTIQRDDETTNVPAGTHLRDVLISYCSNSTNGVVTFATLKTMLKNTKQEISAAPGHKWNVKFPDGSVLSSEIPADAELIEDDDDDAAYEYTVEESEDEA